MDSKDCVQILLPTNHQCSRKDILCNGEECDLALHCSFLPTEQIKWDNGTNVFIKGDEVVIRRCSVRLKIDYPLEKPFYFMIEKDSKDGITRKHLVKSICKFYQKIYREEETKSSHPAGLIPGMLNRQTSNGPYGIWGHDITDLVITDIYYHPESNIVELSVDS